MNAIATSVNNPLPRALQALTATVGAFVRARPVSHLAALTVLGTSIFAVHEGAAAVLPPALTLATTAGMIGCEWLQWTSLGRLVKIEDACDDVRAGMLKAQIAGIGALQVLLYTVAVWNFAREAGLDWGAGWPLAGVVVIAVLFAGLNFGVKHTSCDPVVDTRRPARVTLLPAAENVHAFTRRDREVVQPADRAGVLAIYREAEADRQLEAAEQASIDRQRAAHEARFRSMKDGKGQWKKRRTA